MDHLFPSVWCKANLRRKVLFPAQPMALSMASQGTKAGGKERRQQAGRPGLGSQQPLATTRAALSLAVLPGALQGRVLDRWHSVLLPVRLCGLGRTLHSLSLCSSSEYCGE